jgi:hypothetical protein
MNVVSSPDGLGVADRGAVSHGSRLEVFVLFTTVQETLLALRKAASLASHLNARIEILVPEIVPYPLPIDRPSVAPSFLAHRYRTVVQQSGIDTDIRVCLCREPRTALTAALKPGSVIVIGTRLRWWPTKEVRLSRWLEGQGHRVVVVDRREGA